MQNSPSAAALQRLVAPDATLAAQEMNENSAQEPKNVLQKLTGPTHPPALFALSDGLGSDAQPAHASAATAASSKPRERRILFSGTSGS
jgi:hypothetical protein